MFYCDFGWRERKLCTWSDQVLDAVGLGPAVHVNANTYCMYIHDDLVCWWSKWGCSDQCGRSVHATKSVALLLRYINYTLTVATASVQRMYRRQIRIGHKPGSTTGRRYHRVVNANGANRSTLSEESEWARDWSDRRYHPTIGGIREYVRQNDTDRITRQGGSFQSYRKMPNRMNTQYLRVDYNGAIETNFVKVISIDTPLQKWVNGDTAHCILFLIGIYIHCYTCDEKIVALPEVRWNHTMNNFRVVLFITLVIITFR